MRRALTQPEQQRYRLLADQFDAARKERDLETTKRKIAELTKILRPAGNEAKLNKFKLFYFELALELGETEKAAKGFMGIRRLTPENRRTHLEATFLLALCKLRLGEIAEAKLLVAKVMGNEDVIKSLPRRVEFKKMVRQRFAEESLLAHMKDLGHEHIDPEKLAENAAKLAKNTQAKLFESLGDAAPGEAVLFMRGMDAFTLKQLPYNERLLLGQHCENHESKKLGSALFDAFKRQLYEAFCNPKCDAYKSFYDRPLKGLAWGSPIAAQLVQYLKSQGMSWWSLAVPLGALIIKLGVNTLCQYHAPKGVMVDRR